jgi:hypothetical protein
MRREDPNRFQRSSKYFTTLIIYIFISLFYCFMIHIYRYIFFLPNFGFYNHHRQWHAIHWEKVPRLLRRPPHPCGLDRRSSPNDKWAGGARQWHDFAGTKTEYLQRPQQVWQAVDKRATLGGLESEDNTELSHGFLAVFPSLWGRGHLTHRLRIQFPEDKGIRRPKQPDQPRGFIGPTGRGSGRSLTTLSAVSAVSATLSRPKDSDPRLPSGRLGALATTRRPRVPQAYSPLGRAVHHRQNIEARDIQAGQRSRRVLQQCLEHRTTTSLLPLKCFKSFMYLGPFTCTNKKSNRQGRIGLASAKTDPPSGARREEPPLRQNFPRKSFLPKRLSCLSTISITES